MKPYYPTWATIDLDRINQNLDLIHTKAGTRLFPVVKANAYGHGAVGVASEIAQHKGVDALCVMTVAEASELRRAGITKRLILLGGCSKTQAGEAVGLNCEVVISDLETAKALAGKAGRKPVAVHLKINTGMTRLGVDADDAVILYKKAAALSKIKIASLMTHFAAADSDKVMTNNQIALFDDITSAIKASGDNLPPRSAANTAAIFLHPEARYDVCRPGIGVYGAQPFPGKSRGLKPVMSFYGRVMMTRKISRGETVSYGMTWKSPGEREVAVVSAGYADGYARGLSNQSRAIIKGSYIAQIGVICMDNSLFDVTGKNVKTGDTVTLIGEEGDKKVTAAYLAATQGTIAYEVLCGVGRRAPRLYQKGKRVTSVADYLA